ncbi:GntR family transcriptional regulator [Salicibibacter kimchii]|uniref:GntR family transcriptional regulator n=1 Tax=Salicibibacter kimchii TaxID=2099786 RepID=A0A345C4B6_9BACI|nr:GntR family transcriptional regulator [Salicibibacter kimchii]AXF58047.1 GntR family transcriptional regulator [Salicibibacter kimchii]
MKKSSNSEEPTFIHADDVKSATEGLGNDVTETRLPQRAYQIIRLAVRNLYLPPGKMILEREMAEGLQMSRTPVREALVRLQTEGMIEVIPRRGFIIKAIAKEDLQEIYEIVEALDGLAAEMVTEKISGKELERLEELVTFQEEALHEKNLSKWARLDDKFHTDIINSAGNLRLSSVIETHADQIFRARLFTIENRPLPFRSIIEHKAILSCMRAQDKNAARMLMQSHRKRARNEILEAL